MLTNVNVETKAVANVSGAEQSAQHDDIPRITFAKDDCGPSVSRMFRNMTVPMTAPTSTEKRRQKRRHPHCIAVPKKRNSKNTCLARYSVRMKLLPALRTGALRTT